MTQPRHQVEISEIDALIRQGQLSEARARLVPVVAERGLTPADRLGLASLCRRAGMALKAIQLLNRIVYPSDHSSRVQAQPAYVTEYVFSLLRLGLVQESRELLTGKIFEQNPNAYLAKAFLHFRTWDNADAVPVLRKYLTFQSLTVYERLLGRLNLAAALSWSDHFRDALVEIQSLQKDLDPIEHRMLLGNLNELSAQTLWYLGNETAAMAALSESSRLLGTENILHEKWRAIFTLSRRPNDTQAIQMLQTVREKAVSQNQSEVIRDLDFHLGRLTQNIPLLNRVAFGTPYRSYRDRARSVLKELGHDFPSEFNLHPPGTHDPFEVLNLKTGQLGARKLCKPGSLPVLLLSALVNDFYKKPTLFEISDSVFQGMRFMPESTPDRVHQLIRRTRQILAQKELGLTIYESNEHYELKLEDVGLRLFRPDFVSPEKVRSEGEWEVFMQYRSGENPVFGFQDVMAGLEISKRGAHSRVKDWLSEGRIVRIEKGKYMKRGL